MKDIVVLVFHSVFVHWLSLFYWKKSIRGKEITMSLVTMRVKSRTSMLRNDNDPPAGIAVSWSWLPHVVLIFYGIFKWSSYSPVQICQIHYRQLWRKDLCVFWPPVFSFSYLFFYYFLKGSALILWCRICWQTSTFYHCTFIIDGKWMKLLAFTSFSNIWTKYFHIR